ncbi:MAG TPA: CHAD domain-containing protein [Chthonomonadaceae bacterium]|nr:CHAD domain-containing protein [Chthonomonadaceae bacterium]
MARARPIVGIDPDAPLLASAARIVSARLDEMLAYESCLADADAVYALHQMRIAAKRLRYTMEMFQDAYNSFSRYGKPFAAAIEEIRALQELLGEIHDADVLVPQLTEHLARLLRKGYGENAKGGPRVGVHLVDFEACQGLLTLCRETQAARDARFQQLKERWAQLQQQTYFDTLRALLEKAATEPPRLAITPRREDDGNTAGAQAPRRTRSNPKPSAPPPKDETTHGKSPPVQADDTGSLPSETI